MSRRASSPPSRRVAVPKAKNDIYVALLAIALGALVLACVLLGLEMNRYQWKVKPASLHSPPARQIIGVAQTDWRQPVSPATLA